MKNTRIVRLAACLLILALCVPASAAASSTETASENPCESITVEAGMIDRVVNLFVRLILLLRGSKRLFSDAERATDYIATLVGKQEDFTPPRVSMHCTMTEDTTYGMHCYNIVPPEDTDSAKRILYLPGGAFAREPTSQHFQLVDELVEKTGAAATLVVYPKTPSNDYRVTQANLLALYADLLLTTAPEDIILMGDSAGAAIAVTFAQSLPAQSLPQPSELILYSPLLDLRCNNPAIPPIEKIDPMLGTAGLSVLTEAWLGGEPIDSARVNPICCDLSTLPPTTILIGTADLLYPDAQVFCEKAADAGADITLFTYERMYHCFVLYPLPAARHSIEQSVQRILD